MLKWCGTISCLTLLLAGVLSIRWSFYWHFENLWLSIHSGSVSVVSQEFRFLPHARGLRLAETRANLWTEYGLWPRHTRNNREGRWSVEYSMPLWIPVVLVALPTALLWRTSLRRRAPDACPCGYNLTGNKSGRCPECGQPVARAA